MMKWNGPIRFGTAVLNGTSMHSLSILIIDLRRRGEVATTGRFLVISGGVKPVSKSHINKVPGGDPRWRRHKQ